MKQIIDNSKIPYYEILISLFITTLIISNIASIKIVQFNHLIFDAGTILFPLAYIIGGIITEIYGFPIMRKILYIGIAILIFSGLVLYAVQLMPHPLEWKLQESFSAILGMTWRIFFASIVAIISGELINGYLLTQLKIRTKGKFLWGRLISSSAAGSLIDTIIFSVLAFAGTISNSALLNIIATVFFIKVCTEIILSPITLKAVKLIKEA